MELRATIPAIWGIRQSFWAAAMSIAVMTKMGASVTLLYADMGHLVNDDEIAAMHAMMTKLIGSF